MRKNALRSACAVAATRAVHGRKSFLLPWIVCWAFLLSGWAVSRASAACPLVVRSVHLQRWKAGLLVSGFVVPGFGFSYLADTGWCLRIDVLDARGKLYKQAFTDYLPRPLFIAYHGTPSRSTYAIYLEMKPLLGGLVRVSTHYRPDRASTM